VHGLKADVGDKLAELDTKVEQVRGLLDEQLREIGRQFISGDLLPPQVNRLYFAWAKSAGLGPWVVCLWALTFGPHLPKRAKGRQTIPTMQRWWETTC
jgi:hypothetical protein